MFFLFGNARSKFDTGSKPFLNEKKQRKWLLQTFIELLRFLVTTFPQHTANEVVSRIKELKNRVFSYITHFSLIRFCVSTVFQFFYFWYVAVPLAIYGYVWSGILVVCRRSFHAREFIRHAAAIFRIGRKFIEKTANTKFSDIFENSSQTLQEIISAIFQSTPHSSVHELNLDDICDETELIAYEEFDVPVDGAFDARRIAGMHHRIPRNPFRATITRHRTVSASGTASNSCYGTVSPMSYPTTPTKRIQLIHKCADKVDSVVFAVRDKLRRATQSISRDEYSRHAAAEAELNQQFAMFDPKQTSEGLASTCGHHCILKIGNGIASSARSMFSVRKNTYVYFEYSITVSGNQVPSLAIGLSTKECPLNVMVGNWLHSVGLCTGAILTVGSREFNTESAAANGDEITPGSVVGLLVYLPDSSINLNSDAEPSCAPTDLERPSSPTGLASLTSIPVDPNTMPVFRMNINGQQTQFSEDAMTTTTQELKSALVAESVKCEPPVPVSAIAEVTTNTTMPTSTAASSNQTSKQAVLPAQLAPSSLYPTVSLLSANTRVWCRFCESDIVFRSRHEIGAPSGVRIYCLDGTLLLKENE